MEYVNDEFKVELIHAEESFYRFYFLELIDGEWIDIEDGSWCTQIPIDTSDDLLQSLVEKIMFCAYEDLQSGVYKHRLEELSHINPSWVKVHV